MTLEEFYTKVGSSYAAAMARLRKEELIKKYLTMFLDDPSYKQLCDAVAAQDWRAVFAASHTLKGAAANLELTNLFQAASEVCENTRHGDPELDIEKQMEAVHTEYDIAVNAIREVS